MIATGERTRTAVRIGRIERDKVLNWVGLGIALAVSAILNTWNLAQNGYGNTYYAVAVQSMLKSWHNFFFAAYDAGGFTSVDKPPVALWLQAISAKIFGFSGLSLLLPEAIAGVISVALVYFLVKRIFGSLAGFVAALAMALTPIAVAVERGNNTDTWLMLALILAAWAITLATEKGKLTMLVLAMALVGVAFNIKMLAAFVVLPTFYLLYLVAAPIRWPKRILHLALASVVLLAVALSWPLAVDLTPASQRPYVGGSTNNSVLQLALGYNGLGRVTGNEGAGSPGGGTRSFQSGDQGTMPAFGGQTPPEMPSGVQPPSGTQAPPSGGFGGFQGGGPGGTNSSGMFGAGVAGPLRLFGSELASQWSWLLPLAVFGVLATVLSLRRHELLGRKSQALILWAGWLVTYGAVFSMAEGIFHVYYLIMLAPAAAALVGIGVASMWGAYRDGGWKAWLLPLALVATAAWQVKVLNDYNYPQWSAWLIPITVAGSIIAAIPLLASRLFTARVWRRTAPVLLGLALAAVLVAPLAWSVTPVLAVGNGIMPQAGPTTRSEGFGGGQAQPGGQGRDSAGSGLVSYLQQNQDGYLYLVAVSSANQASDIALSTGQPVLAMGGFTGSDPAMTVEKLQQMIAGKQVRFVMTGGMGGQGGGTSSVNQWVQTNCTAVDSSAYSGSGSTSGFGVFGGRGQLYSCSATN